MGRNLERRLFEGILSLGSAMTLWQLLRAAVRIHPLQGAEIISVSSTANRPEIDPPVLDRETGIATGGTGDTFDVDYHLEGERRTRVLHISDWRLKKDRTGRVVRRAHASIRGNDRFSQVELDGGQSELEDVYPARGLKVVYSSTGVFKE